MKCMLVHEYNLVRCKHTSLVSKFRIAKYHLMYEIRMNVAHSLRHLEQIKVFVDLLLYYNKYIPYAVESLRNIARLTRMCNESSYMHREYICMKTGRTSNHADGYIYYLCTHDLLNCYPGAHQDI